MSKKREVGTIFPPFLGFLSAMEEADELTVEEKDKTIRGIKPQQRNYTEGRLLGETSGRTQQ